AHWIPGVGAQPRTVQMVAARRSGDLVFYGVARGIFFSRDLAKLAHSIAQEKLGGMDSRIGGFWLLSHPAQPVSKLEVRLSRDDRRPFLRPRLHQERLANAGCVGPRSRRYLVARTFPLTASTPMAQSNSQRDLRKNRMNVHHRFC